MAKKKDEAKPAQNKGDEEYELVPESKFSELEARIDDISKSPFVKTAGVEKISAQLEGTQDSILSLLEILKQIAKATASEDTEKDFVRKQIKPLVTDINKLKEQNDILANNMLDILNKLNDIQTQLSSNQIKISQFPNPSLPPLDGGPTPPPGFNFESESSNNNSFIPPPLNGKPVTGLPPLNGNGF